MNICWSKFYLVVAFVLITTACGTVGRTMPVTSTTLFPYSVVDSNGREILFNAPPERVIVFDSAALETLFAIGEGHRVVGTHDFVTYPPQARDVVKVGDSSNLNLEQTVALKPDLVFVFFGRYVEDLERMGLRVLYIKTLNNDFTKVADLIRMWGRITGAVYAAEEVALDFEERVNAVERTAQGREHGPSVLLEVGGLWSAGPDTLIGEVFDLLKFRNIAHDVTGYAQISPEVIVERDPAVIISAYPDSIIGNEAFHGVKAVRDGKVYQLSTDALSIAGPRFVAGIEELAGLVYPDLFD